MVPVLSIHICLFVLFQERFWHFHIDSLFLPNYWLEWDQKWLFMYFYTFNNYWWVDFMYLKLHKLILWEIYKNVKKYIYSFWFCLFLMPHNSVTMLWNSATLTYKSVFPWGSRFQEFSIFDCEGVCTVGKHGWGRKTVLCHYEQQRSMRKRGESQDSYSLFQSWPSLFPVI